MTQTANYAAMSKPDLIAIIENQKRIIQRFYRLLPIENKKLAPGEKLAWSVAKPLIDSEKPNEQGLVRIPIDKIAEKIGMSESSVSRYIDNICSRFDATHEVEPYTTKKGQKCNLTYINPTEPVWDNPWNIDLPEEKERPINGNGKYCDRCKTNNLKITTHRLTYQEVQECECCGYTKISPVLTDKEELTAGEYIPAKKGSQPEEPFSEEHQEDEKGSEICNPYVPSTPSIADADSLSSQKGLQAGEPFLDIEKEAAQLLLEIAGQGPADEHIEMCKRGPEKYTTIKRALNLGDLRAHLRGYKTKGATLQHGVNTRAIVFDVDTPEGWQRLQEAAQSLAIVDFKPILEPSPVPEGDHAGGGHLWMIFDGLVNAYSALQTIYQYTGGLLAECKEYWPREGNHRVRLPGGKYVKSGFEAWCKLYDADGNELSHDGTGAAAVLLDYQTPASVVNEYTKPEPTPAPQGTTRQPVGGYLDKDLARQYIDEFNDQRSWSDIAAMVGGFNRNRKFLAEWRGDRTPNVSVNPRTDLAKDFARQDEPAMDKYEVWCKIMAHRLGQDWQLFKKQDLAQRCEYRRQQRERRAS